MPVPSDEAMNVMGRMFGLATSLAEPLTRSGSDRFEVGAELVRA